jgi:hypothetical protein
MDALVEHDAGGKHGVEPTGDEGDRFTLWL